ncbi:MAG: hypothetical protein OJF49_001712 [Ktedonobacterales bacterium]|jgi:hypothetical protein|nr:MAG: hypothetical protein OJF49_001712 [Ktedonobacterales bacterium]
MPARGSFDYAIIRIIPRVERGERINVGVVLHSREHAFLAARIAFDPARLLALAPELSPTEIAEIAAHLDSIPRICAGGEDAGPIGRLTLAERFHWLVSPRSTIIQPSRVHSGICADPTAALDHLARILLPTPTSIPASIILPRADYDTALATLRRSLAPNRTPAQMRRDITAALADLERMSNSERPE